MAEARQDRRSESEAELSSDEASEPLFRDTAGVLIGGLGSGRCSVGCVDGLQTFALHMAAQCDRFNPIFRPIL